MINLFYCNSWSWGYKSHNGLLTEYQARKLHDQGKRYSVLVNDPERPDAVVDMINNLVAVTYVDQYLRQQRSFDFKQIEPGKLFLSIATHREYYGDDPENDEIKYGCSYIFKQDGSMEIRRHYYNPDEFFIRDSSFDVSGNYESYPEFGDYDQLLKIDQSVIFRDEDITNTDQRPLDDEIRS